MKLCLCLAEKAIDEYGIKALAPNGNFWYAKRNGKTKKGKDRQEYRIPIRLGFRNNTYATQDSEWNFPGDGNNADFQIQTIAGKGDFT